MSKVVEDFCQLRVGKNLTYFLMHLKARPRCVTNNFKGPYCRVKIVYEFAKLLYLFAYAKLTFP